MAHNRPQSSSSPFTNAHDELVLAPRQPQRSALVCDKPAKIARDFDLCKGLVIDDGALLEILRPVRVVHPALEVPSRIGLQGRSTVHSPHHVICRWALDRPMRAVRSPDRQVQ